MNRIQQIADATPGWANWAVISGSWLVAFIIPVLQAFAFFVTVVWGGLQIHGYVKREFGVDLFGWFRKDK